MGRADTLAAVTDVKRDQKQAGIDQLMVHLARARVALGVAAFAAPTVTGRVMGFGGDADAGRTYMTRAFGAREIAFGAGYLLSKGTGRKAWARLGVLVDSLDTVAGLKSRRALPPLSAAGATAVAAGAAVLGAVAVSKKSSADSS